MHFMVEAKASGFVPPADVFQSGLRFLQKMVTIEPRNMEEARTVAYAIYVLTREEVITTNYILNLEDYLDKHFKDQWHNDLTGVYLAGSLQILKKDAEAEKLIGAYKVGIHDETQSCDFYQPLGEDSQYVAIVARHFPGMLRKMTASDFEVITRPIGEGDFNTLSAAYAVLALKSYAQHMAQNPPALGISEIGKDQHETELQVDGKLLKRAAFSANATALKFTAAPAIRGIGAFYQVIETGFDAHPATTVVKDGLEVYREIVDDNGNPTTTAYLGKPVKVRLKIRGLKEDTITNVAIVDLLPGGFEVVGDSLKPGLESAGCDYVDVREDRVVFFTSIGAGMNEITYQMKADNRGEFVVPPLFAESMYDRGVKGRGLPGHITVVEAQGK
jgi:alpha-2-macroglobulin